MTAIALWLVIGGVELGQGSDPGASRTRRSGEESGGMGILEPANAAVAYEPAVGFTQIAGREGA